MSDGDQKRFKLHVDPEQMTDSVAQKIAKLCTDKSRWQFAPIPSDEVIDQWNIAVGERNLFSVDRIYYPLNGYQVERINASAPEYALLRLVLRVEYEKW